MNGDILRITGEGTRFLPSVATVNLNAVARGPDTMVAVGDDGVILLSRSGDAMPPGYDQWAEEQGLSGWLDDPVGDPNFDGVTNLGTYFHGIPALGPTTSPDQLPLPTAEPDGSFVFRSREFV